jgi:glucose dehydrogenase
MAHHGLWDYDPPAAPNLVDVRVNGALVTLVAQVSKQGFVPRVRPRDRPLDVAD